MHSIVHKPVNFHIAAMCFYSIPPMKPDFSHYCRYCAPSADIARFIGLQIPWITQNRHAICRYTAGYLRIITGNHDLGQIKCHIQTMSRTIFAPILLSFTKRLRSDQCRMRWEGPTVGKSCPDYTPGRRAGAVTDWYWAAYREACPVKRVLACFGGADCR